MVIAPPTSCEHILFDSLLVGGLEPLNFMTFHFIYGMSSFPLTPSFFRGLAATTNQS
jgi:hypothetical protein